MEDYGNEEKPELETTDRSPSTATRWLVIVSVVLFAAAIFAVGYAIERSEAVAALNQQNQAMQASETQMRGQIDVLTAKINQLSAPPVVPPTPLKVAPVSGKSSTKHPAAARSSAQDRRIRQMQAQITEQQKQLKQTQDDIASARTDLQGQLGSTRDELNGSIARTHDELVTLEKKGERSYFEFDLTKSKQFEHEGPLQISLRKADSKHQSYDLMMLVDDHQLSKKKVDLYEPIWLHESDQPVQIVVNQISKNHIHGYISAPKYTESQLSSSAAQPATLHAGAVSNPPADSSSYSASHASSTTPATSSQAQPRPVD